VEILDFDTGRFLTALAFQCLNNTPDPDERKLRQLFLRIQPIRSE